jgi:hypothetical protein
VADDATRDARLRVLELLAQHRISADEAADLIRALEGRPAERRRRDVDRLAPPESRSDRPSVLRVRVTDMRSGRIRTNVAVPLPSFAMGIGLRLARRFRLPGPDSVDEIYEALRTGRRGVIVDVANEHGERVEVLIE